MQNAQNPHREFREPTQGALTHSEELNSLGIFEDGSPQDPSFSLKSLPLQIRGFDTTHSDFDGQGSVFLRSPVLQQTEVAPLVSTIFLGGQEDLKPPPTPRLRTIPLPQETPKIEPSTSLAAAKPGFIQYDIQSASNEDVDRAPVDLPGPDPEMLDNTLSSATPQWGEGGRRA